MHFVYVLCDRNGGLYVGFTSDLEKRLAEHNAEKNRSTKGGWWKVVYYEAYANREDAVRREKALKQRGQAKRHLKDRITGSVSSCV